MEIAVQQLMLGKVLKNKLKALDALNKIKDVGYTAIELDGFMIRKMPFIVKWITDLAGMPTGNSTKLDWLNLTQVTETKVISIHEDLGTIETKTESVVKECEDFNCTYVVVTGMYQYDYDSIDCLDSLISRLNQAGQALLEQGIHLLYHNHNTEFSRLPNGLTAYEYLIQGLDPNYVNFEFDSYWATDAGINVIDMIYHLGDRLKLYHINDRQKKKKGVSTTPIVKFDAAELGTGIMDLDGILAAVLSTKCEAVILEQHKNWIHGSPLESLQVSAKYLKVHIQ